MENVIAEQKLYSITANGESKPLILRIGAPEKKDEETWRCPWEIEGLYTKVSPAIGISSLHSLVLVVALFEQQLKYFVEDGGKLYLELGGTEISVSEIIPRFKLQKKKKNL